MDRVFSTRLDEEVITLLNSLAQQRGASKKSVLEEAIRKLTAEMAEAQGADPFTESSGAWAGRLESPAQTVGQARAAFEKSMHRHPRL